MNYFFFIPAMVINFYLSSLSILRSRTRTPATPPFSHSFVRHQMFSHMFLAGKMQLAKRNHSQLDSSFQSGTIMMTWNYHRDSQGRNVYQVNQHHHQVLNNHDHVQSPNEYCMCNLHARNSVSLSSLSSLNLSTSSSASPSPPGGPLEGIWLMSRVQS